MLREETSAHFWKDTPIFDILIWGVMGSVLLTVVDNYNLVSLAVEKYGYKIVIYVAIVIAVTLFLILLKYSLFQFFKIPYRNRVDELVLSLAICLILYLFTAAISKMLVFYKAAMAGGAFVISMIEIIGRYSYCYTKSSEYPILPKYAKLDGSVDLRDFMRGTSYEDRKELHFTEDAVAYDLLDRNGLIDLLYSSIITFKKFNYEQAYAIGVNGEWGNGKTTIINIVKNKLLVEDDLIIIDDFDPWVYGSQEALINAFYDKILLKAGFRGNFLVAPKMWRQLLNLVTDEYKVTGIARIFAGALQDNNIEEQIKGRISTYLNRMGKTAVVFIDNLDRADADMILFLYKLIGTVFRIPHVLYVLSYSGRRIDEIFSDSEKVNSAFKDKIIQQEIMVPAPSPEKMSELSYEIVQKLLRHYGVPSEEFYLYESAIKLVARKTNSLRQLKRLLNTVFIATFQGNDCLYKPQLLEIELIRFLEPQLYENIKNNREYYTNNYLDYTAPYSKLFTSAPDESGKEGFFATVLKEYPEYREVMAELFEDVDSYVTRLARSREKNIYYISIDHRSTISISNQLFFDLYFTYSNSRSITIHRKLSELVARLNSSAFHPDVVREEVLNQDPEDVRIFLETLQSFGLGAVHDSVAFATGLYETVGDLSECDRDGVIPARKRAIIILTATLVSLRKDDAEKFISTIRARFDFYTIDEIINTLKVLHRDDEAMLVELLRYIRGTRESLQRSIINGKVDILSDEYYIHGNLLALEYSRGMSDEVFFDYVLNIANSDNIFKIIFEFFGETRELGGYRYKMYSSRLSNWMRENDSIRNLLDKTSPKTQDESFILDMWKEGQERGFCVRFREERLLKRCWNCKHEL